MYCSTPCLAVLSCVFFSALCNVVPSYNVFYSSALCHAVLCSAVLYTAVLCCAIVYAAETSSKQTVQCEADLEVLLELCLVLTGQLLMLLLELAD